MYKKFYDKKSRLGPVMTSKHIRLSGKVTREKLWVYEKEEKN